MIHKAWKVVDIKTGFKQLQHTTGGYGVIIFHFGTNACNHKDAFIGAYK